MATHTIKKLPKNTIEMSITIPWNTIQEEYTKSFDELVKDVKVEGFRKGKAPRDVARKHLPQDKVYDHMLRHYLPAVYEAALKKEDFKPAAQPQIKLEKAKENEDWIILFTIPLIPEVKLKDYKKTVKKAKEEAEKPEIWTPDKGSESAQKDVTETGEKKPQDSSSEEKKSEPTEQQKKEKQLQDALDALVKESSVEISDVLLDSEIEGRMSRLHEDLKRLGISIESYVQSRNTTLEELREQIRKETEESYKLEYILQAIGDEEKIQVEKEDIDKMMANLQNEEEKKAFVQNIYYYASLLRKQKILDHLMSI
ncbi:MAG: trigger factor [Patescibacteria group bacterium]